MKKGIRIVKTWHGLRYGIVNLNTKPVLSVKTKQVLFKPIQIDVMETPTGPLLFPYTKEGLSKAKEILKLT